VPPVVELPIFSPSEVPRFQIFASRFASSKREPAGDGGALAGDRRIGLVAILSARIASMRGNSATFSIGCAGTIEDREFSPNGSYNIVLLGTERFRICCEQPLTATRLYRIAEAERLEEADDPEGTAEFVRQRAHLMSWFSELMSQLASIEELGAAKHAGARAPTSNSLDEIENAVLTHIIASDFNFTAKRKRDRWKKMDVARTSNGSAFFFASRSQNSTPPECRIRAPCTDSLMRTKNVDIFDISPKNFEFKRSGLIRFRPATRFSKARINLKAGREVPGMESRSGLQTVVFRRYQGDSILPLLV
jgi:hypothetical protein